MISGDRPSSMGRSTAGHGHPRVVLIASECNHKCNHRGRASPDAIAVGVQTDSGDIELWRALGVNRGVLGVSAEVMAQCRGGDQVCDLVDLLPDLARCG